MSQTIQIGDTVTWESQAGGSKKAKTGKVVSAIPKWMNPIKYTLNKFPEHRRMFDGITIPLGAQCGYLVEVQETPNQRPKLYMPRPRWLTVLKEKSDEQID